MCWREMGTDLPSVIWNGDTLAIGAPERRSCWPNELKLSDRHRRRKAKSTEKGWPPVPVRWSAWLGRGPGQKAPKRAKRAEKGQKPRGKALVPRGKAPVPRGKGAVPGGKARVPPGKALVPRGKPPVPPGKARVPGGTGAVPRGKGGKPNGLTPPSSATEAGEARRNQQGRADRQPLFAGARG